MIDGGRKDGGHVFVAGARATEMVHGNATRRAPVRSLDAISMSPRTMDSRMVCSDAHICESLFELDVPRRRRVAPRILPHAGRHGRGRRIRHALNVSQTQMAAL